MRLKNITATPHPFGNRIDLEWINPDPLQYPGVRIVRREGTHPTSPEDGVVVLEEENPPYTVDENGERVYEAVDKNLKGETVYYYFLFPYKGNPPEYRIVRRNRIAAMSTSRYDIAGQMYSLLPAVYHRYDTALAEPGEVSEEDRQKGQLRRFLDLPGSQLDRLYSSARSILDLYNLDKVDGSLLPLLAEWIGWKTDFSLEIGAQRNEIRNAPAIYKTIGIIPTVEATVKRISGWESRTKEFVHNVFSSNSPERLNIWTRRRNSAGEWLEPSELISLDFAYEGRPAAVRDGDGTLWLFYHTLRNGRWNIWYKTLSTFSIDSGFRNDLDKGAVSAGMQQAFIDEGFPLSPDASAEKEDDLWIITDLDNGEIYSVREEGGDLNVYRWAPSRPLTRNAQIDKHPAAVMQGGTLWVFWDSYSETTGTWHINYQTRAGGVWSAVIGDELFADTTNERKNPWAVVDNTGGLWLFWLERVGTRWQLKYNRHNGADWQLDPAAAFPLDGGADPRVESDIFVLFHPADAAQRLWVFWAGKDSTVEPDRTRWQIAYRVKQGINPNSSDWSVIRALPKDAADPDYHDREPAAIVNADGDIEVFQSSNRGGSWSIWRNTLDAAAHTWSAGEQVTDSPYSQRDPVSLPADGGTLLVYRSNESLPYKSGVYGATETVDFRYAGSTTARTRDSGKIALRGKFEDFQTYTYDAVGKNGKRTDEDWYARDTIALYIKPDTVDAEKIERGISRIDKVLREFMPITDRAVFIAQSDAHTDLIYTYGLPGAAEPSFITESYQDTFTSVIEEAVLGIDEDFLDEIE